MTPQQVPSGTKPVATWLFITAFAVFMMAIIGAITRLTESGLSIVEWKPITGIMPPLDDAAWQAEFDKYLQSPQGRKINPHISLAEFKDIFFWEWVHRQWGRMIGLIYFIPLLFFWRRLPSASRPLFLGMLALGFAQGFMGWIMVKSGLVDNPAVSHYRLAAHLMLAALIYACLFRLGLAFSVRPEKDAGTLSPLRPMVWGAIALVAVTMTWGAFVAGLDAGMVYNTFPKMNDHWLPPELFAHQPMWRAFLEEPATVQFTHRVLAVLLVVKVLLLWKKSRGFHLTRRVSRLVNASALMVLVQAGLGITTLLTQVNMHAATAHQGGAFILLALLVWLVHEIPHVRKEK